MTAKSRGCASSPVPNRIRSVFKTGYADMAIAPGACSNACRRPGPTTAWREIPVCLPTPIAPTYNNMVLSDRPANLPALTAHFANEVAAIAAAIPHDRLAIGTFARRRWPGRGL